MFQLRRVLEFTPRRIAAGYAVFGGLWIVISDQLVFALFASESDHEVTVDISDNGPGILEAEVAPVESGIESQLSHGSGVGLWLIDWLCRSNSGSADFETNEGTTVSMTLEQPDQLDTVTNRLQSELKAVPTH